MAFGLSDGIFMHAPLAERRSADYGHHRQSAQSEYQIAQAPRELRPRSACVLVRPGRALRQTAPLVTVSIL